MNIREKVIIAVLSISLLIPATTFANNNVEVITNIPSIKERNIQDRKEIPEETKKAIRDLKTRLENGEITKEEFRKEIKKLLPEKYHFKNKKGKKHYKKMEVPEEVKAKFQELKSKLESGEITKDEFRKEIRKLMPEKYKDNKKRKDCPNKKGW